MEKEIIRNQINKMKDKWYYYYNFDGIEVQKHLKKNKADGIKNWKKLGCVFEEIFDIIDSPYVFDIGCNMALYAHEMTKMGAKVFAVDQDIDTAEFYKRYTIENKKEDWKVILKKMNIKKEVPKNFEVNIVTMFCVIYHLIPDHDNIINKIKNNMPNHKYIVIQGNNKRIIKKKQRIAGVPGIVDFLKKHKYNIHKIYTWNDYQKPVVVGTLL